MSLYSTLAHLLDDIHMIRQALERMASLSSVVESADPEKQLEVLEQTLAVDAMSPSRLDGRRFWRGLLHLQCDELESAEDPVFRLDALIKAGLEWQHKYCDARKLYRQSRYREDPDFFEGESFPEILSPGALYSKKYRTKPKVIGWLDKRTLKEFPLALQARVRLQRSYVNLYKARDRTREVQHTLPYKVATETYDTVKLTTAHLGFAELYNLCLGASEGQGRQGEYVQYYGASKGQGRQEVVKAWEVWEASRHPIHFLDLFFKLTEPLVCYPFMSPQLEPKLLEFLQYELPKSSWRFFRRVNAHDSECVNFDLLHRLCEMDFPLSGKYMEELADMVRSRRALDYLPSTFVLTVDTSPVWGWGANHPAGQVLRALQLDTTPDPWEDWDRTVRSRLNSFDTSHWTETLIKVVGENSPRNLRSKDLVQIFKYFKSGWSNEEAPWEPEILAPRQLALVEKWITECGCEKLKALSELYIN